MGTGRFRATKEKSLLTVWYKPDSYWDVVVNHLPFAFFSGLGLLLPTLVPLHSLPLLKCTFLCVTGFPCPFCGFTRSFWAISAGQWGFAVHDCPLSLGIYGLMAILFTWHLTALLLRIRMNSGFYRLLKLPYTWWIISALFLLNWAYRIALGKM